MLSVERASPDPLSPRRDHTELGSGQRISPIGRQGPLDHQDDHVSKHSSRCQSSMLPQHDDDAHDLARWSCTTLPHGWRVPNHLRLLRAPYPRAWHDHRSLDWRKSACCSPGAVAAQRARGSKNTHGCVPRLYSYGHICHGRRGPERPLKAVSACSMKNLSKVIARESPGRDKG